MSIGNQAHATLALAADREYQDLLYRTAPEWSDVLDAGSWEGKETSWALAIGPVSLVGQGSTRRVWTIDGKVAYKIASHNGADQRSEWDRWVKFHDKMPEGTRLPDMHAYYVDNVLILAVEIIKFPRQWNGPATPALPFQFHDDGDYNCRWAPDGTFIPIDFAF